jgi:hypothetical protein
MSTYLENLTTEELCVKLEDDELITLNMIKEAVRRLRGFSYVLENDE